MLARYMVCLLATCLLAAIPSTAQTAAEITGEAQTSAAGTAGALTASGAPAEEDTTTYTADFEADASEYLDVADPFAEMAAMTLAYWIKPEGTASCTHFIHGTAGDYSWAVGQNAAATQIIMRFSETGVDSTTNGGHRFTVISAGTWVHIVWVFDGGGAANADRLKIFIDGSPEAMSAFDGTIPAVVRNSSASFGVGQNSAPGGNVTFDGLMAIPAIWTTNLGAADISTLYASGPTLRHADLTAAQKTNLVSWWDLDEESGTRADSHGANHLTDVNTVGQAEVIYP